jgi:hypothetical protein
LLATAGEEGGALWTDMEVPRLWYFVSIAPLKLEADRLLDFTLLQVVHIDMDTICVDPSVRSMYDGAKPTHPLLASQWTSSWRFELVAWLMLVLVEDGVL